MEDCVVIPSQPFYGSLFYQVKGKRNTYPGCVLNGGGQNIGVQYSNIVNIYFGSISSVVYSNLPKYSSVAYNNYINCYSDYGRGGLYQGREYWLQNYRESPGVDITEKPSYFGTSREDIVRGYLYEMGNAPSTYGTIDLSDMRTTPVPEAHGIVWKVVVNGKDAQDEYEELAPLGVGKHKFEVYFNRPMNKNVAPNITFGLRDPYTQNAVNEDGSWNEDGTIYTAYKTITGKTKSDGVNRIYVNGAEDNEYFEIPYEKTRFNINVQAVGSMATGFMANPGMGKVDLTLDHTNNNFDDAMGFNIYRYCEDIKKTIPAHYDANWNWIEETEVIDTIRINQEILDITTESYPDYDVIPGKTYCYYYKVLSTDLQEYDVSNVVAATPLTTIMGDANGSGNVSVADVISTVDYVLGENPKPFIFEAADLNTDNNVDVLDVIGIIQIILNQPSSSRAEFENVAEAVYTVENGMLYIETPVTLSGLQIQVSTNEQPMTTNEMKGFEIASSWLTESDYRILAYSFGSKTLAPGKHAIMTIGDADITSLRLADVNGNNVLAMPGETTAVKDAMGSKVMLTKGVYNLSGQKVAGKDNSKLRKGVYIIDGQKIVK